MDEDQLEKIIALQTSLGWFPYWYTTTLRHSRFDNITVAELSALSDKSKLNAEFLSASGQREIDFRPLKEAIVFIDKYLKTGSLREETCKNIISILLETEEKMKNIVADYQDAGHAEENGAGAPIWCFVHGYAANLLGICVLIEDVCEEGDDKIGLLNLLNERKRQDPDADPSKDKIPEPA